MSSGVGSVYDYIIDGSDVIVRVSANWPAFAHDNAGGDSCDPDKVLNRPIWEFVSGAETELLYREILASVRKKKAWTLLPFRCDAPDRRRYLELNITPLPEESVAFSSRIVREEERDPVALLDAGLSRSGEIIVMCSMCKRIRLPEQVWAEIEAAIHTLDLFGEPEMPQISHGLCPTCFEEGLAAIGKDRR